MPLFHIPKLSGALIPRLPLRRARYSTGQLPPLNSPIPVITTLPELRAWRRAARQANKSVGIVPTMGALHEGHLDLVKRSMAANPLTVMTLFVNPTQFAPHEDLASYPRTLDSDLERLTTLLPSRSPRGRLISSSSQNQSRNPTPSSSFSGSTSESVVPSEDLIRGLGVSEHDPARAQPPSHTSSPSSSSSSSPNSPPSLDSPLVVFAPSREVMYPLSSLPGPFDAPPRKKSIFSSSSSVEDIMEGEGGDEAETATGMLQDTSKQRGGFVEVKGWGDVMEGASRPQFFRGVATVCTKLFNAVEPDHAYFGQKDIQQALLLKIMLKDLLFAYPTTDNLHIIPTTRSPLDSLALSSRNAYLTPSEHPYASTLYTALSSAKSLQSISPKDVTADDMVRLAEKVVRERAEEAKRDGVEMRLDYVEVFDKGSFRSLRGGEESMEGVEAVISGAMWLGRTRLIDNLLIGWES